MKRAIALLIPAFILAIAAGCDEQALLSTAKSALLSRGDVGQMMGDVLQTQTRTHSRLQDGSCTGDMNQYQYGGASGQGGNGGGGNGGGARGNGGGDQDQIRLRLRDGSCQDPNTL